MDHFLTPYNAENFQTNLQVATRYDGAGQATSGIYETVLRNGINVPYMWQFNVPKASGGTKA